MKRIPIDWLSEQAGLKIEIMRFEMKDIPYAYDEASIERNDHYVFLLCEKGSAKLIVDFRNIILHAGSVYHAIPGQITHRMYDQCLAGWYLAIDSSLVSTEFRSIFKIMLESQIPLILKPQLLHQCLSILSLINNRMEDQGKTRFDEQVTYALLQSFIGIIAGTYCQQDTWLSQIC